MRVNINSTTVLKNRIISLLGDKDTRYASSCVESISKTIKKATDKDSVVFYEGNIMTIGGRLVSRIKLMLGFIKTNDNFYITSIAQDNTV